MGLFEPDTTPDLGGFLRPRQAAEPLAQLFDPTLETEVDLVARWPSDADPPANLFGTHAVNCSEHFRELRVLIGI